MASGTYSLWLMPEGEPRERFAAIIDELAASHGGPRFAPHITLLGGLTAAEDGIVQRAEEIARQVPPLQLDVEGIGAEDVYFSTLYAIVRPVPPLLAANETARRVFGLNPPEPFRPHLSLLYGIYPPEKKRAIINDVQDRLPSACDVRALEVYRTERPVESWRLVRRIGLTGA
jgi:2'-5' RNA ligase